MARHYNRVILIGNLTREPELRYTPNNTAVAEFGLAVNRNYQDGSGEWQEDTTYVDITVWGNKAENADEYLSKGSRVFLEGRLRLDQWENDAGENRSKHGVTAERLSFLGGGSGNGNQQQGSGPEEELDDMDDEIDDPEDDVPF